MLQEWSALLAPAVQDRLCLLLNHVIGREPLAMARLQPFAGRAFVLRLRGWPALLPAAPDLGLGISRAGLLERLEAAPSDALLVEVEAGNPALMALTALAGGKPQVTVQGDAALAAELSWLMENLRWDIEDDLAQLTGPAVAHQLAQLGRAAAGAAATLAKGASAWVPGQRGAP